MSEHCDRAWEIDALREGRLTEKDGEAFERHARSCDVCTRTRAQNGRLRALAENVAIPDPSELDVRRLRARVLRDVELQNPSPGAWRRKTIAALALVAAASGALVSLQRSLKGDSPQLVASAAPAAPSALVPVDEFAGFVTPNAGARWTQSRSDAVERVRLDDGTLQLHVRHQTVDEHFFVDVPDGVIEVRGTTFRVDVTDGITQHIDVTEGVVSFRPTGGSESLIGAGQRWTPRAPAPIAARRSPTATAPMSSASQMLDHRTSDQYASAVALLQSGSYDAAARAFADFLSAHPNAAEAEDASYLEAASLARAGRNDAAALAAEHHLSAYPRSFHREEAAILVARAARDRGDCAKARDVLAPWLGTNPDAEAVATLRWCAD